MATSPQAPTPQVDPLSGRRGIALPGGVYRGPSRDLQREPAMSGAAPDMADMTQAHASTTRDGLCPPNWWFHDRQEFRMSAAVANTVIATFRLTVPALDQPGFWLRIQNPYEQFLNNVLTANGAQVPGMVYRVRIQGELLDRDFVPSSIDGAWWVPYCVRTDYTVEVTASPAAGVAGQFSNAPIRLACEISVGAQLPYLTPMDRRRNSMRSFAVVLGAGALVPTVAIGAGSVFVATIPNAPWFIVPGTLRVGSLAGGAQVFYHGISVAGAIDAGGQAIPTGLVPQVLDVDRLDKIAFSKPLAGAATLSISFAIYD